MTLTFPSSKRDASHSSAVLRVAFQTISSSPSPLSFFQRFPLAGISRHRYSIPGKAFSSSSFLEIAVFISAAATVPYHSQGFFKAALEQNTLILKAQPPSFLLQVYYMSLHKTGPDSQLIQVILVMELWGRTGKRKSDRSSEIRDNWTW